MSKEATKLTNDARSISLEWLKQWVKPEFLNALGLYSDEWIKEIETTVCQRIPGEHEPTWELNSHYSKTGNPLLLGFADNDFVWSDMVD